MPAEMWSVSETYLKGDNCLLESTSDLILFLLIDNPFYSIITSKKCNVATFAMIYSIK